MEEPIKGSWHKRNCLHAAQLLPLLGPMSWHKLTECTAPLMPGRTAPLGGQPGRLLPPRPRAEPALEAPCVAGPLAALQKVAPPWPCGSAPDSPRSRPSRGRSAGSWGQA